MYIKVSKFPKVVGLMHSNPGSQKCLTLKPNMEKWSSGCCLSVLETEKSERLWSLESGKEEDGGKEGLRRSDF